MLTGLVNHCSASDVVINPALVQVVYGFFELADFAAAPCFIPSRVGFWPRQLVWPSRPAVLALHGHREAVSARLEQVVGAAEGAAEQVA